MRHFRYFAVSRREQNEVDDFFLSISRLKSMNHDSPIQNSLSDNSECLK